MKKTLILASFVALTTFDALAQNFSPSIMVVPYKKESQSYIEAFENNEDSRLAIEKVNEGLQKHDIQPLDFIAYMNQTIKAGEYEDGVAVGGADKVLLDQSGSDIYITVDMQKKQSYSGNAVSIAIKAYDRSTGSILASKVGLSPAFKTEFYDKLCMLAVDNIFKDGFLDELEAAFEKRGAQGSFVTLRIALGDNSSSISDMAVYNLMQHQTPNGRLSDVIRGWMRENTVDGSFNIKGANAELIIYEQVAIPPITPDGYTMYPVDFASEFVSFLSSLSVIAEERVDGNTILITIY